MGPSFGAEGITIKSEAEVADGIARGAASRRSATATGARRFAVD
jgi:hypothetical protein